MSARESSDEFKVKVCRICGEGKFFNFLDLHSMPVPNGFVVKEDLGKFEQQYPLAVMACETCWLVQVTHVVPPGRMFENYLYIPSTSTTMLNHFNSMAKSLVKQFDIKPSDVVMDIGSNDGTLLSFFRQEGVQVLGVDPAANLAHLARMKGINTINALFSSKLASDIVGQGTRPRLITATNVVAHMSELHDFCKGVNSLLDDQGVLVTEFPYCVDMLQKLEFDTIYHEHLSYISLLPFSQLMAKFKMRIFDVQRNPVHGGTARVFVCKEGARYQQTKELEKCLADERAMGLQTRKPYIEFAEKVQQNCVALVKYLKELKAAGKRVVGYGASAKGNVLLNYCKITPDLVEYVVDSIPFKQWRFTPGTHIPIYPEQKLQDDRPDYALLLAWNFQEEIVAKQAAFRDRGGKFIVPIPTVTTI